MQVSSLDLSHEIRFDDSFDDSSRFDEQRRRARQTVWKEHIDSVEAWRIGYERLTAAAAARSAGIERDFGLEL